VRIIIQHIFLFLFVAIDQCVLNKWCEKHIENLVKAKASVQGNENLELTSA
jgi:hypothetical protein